MEVQWASETAIAAVERCGGRIRTAYYDINSLEAAVNPQKWFLSGKPIPRRLAPPESLLDYYTDPRNRGYLADEMEIRQEEINLGQLMGYNREEAKDHEWERKKPDQVFVGLECGSLVSMADRKVFLPTNPVLRRYYGLDKENDKDILADHQYA
ncbi:unnamed protein product [Anisakis simplex]|uniref:39S ribosomal protein L15, mitochondrial n=1 Tax=Anisakis simplex TaxID=6269 RepID=A0A3P6THT2_ANISI|nr:unnamed protein product [Anisakis simplex]